MIKENILNIFSKMKNKTLEIFDEIKADKYKFMISFLFSVIISCLLSYIVGLSIYSKEGCSNSLGIILGSGLAGFLTFSISCFFSFIIMLFLLYKVEDIKENGFNNSFGSSVDWEIVKEALLYTVKVLVIISLILLIGGYIAGQILNAIIC